MTVSKSTSRFVMIRACDWWQRSQESLHPFYSFYLKNPFLSRLQSAPVKSSGPKSFLALVVIKPDWLRITPAASVIASVEKQSSGGWDEAD